MAKSRTSFCIFSRAQSVSTNFVFNGISADACNSCSCTFSVSHSNAATRIAKLVFFSAAKSIACIARTKAFFSNWDTSVCIYFSSAANSGRIFCKAPDSCKTWNSRDGFFSIKPRDNSCHTRSETNASTSPACTIVCMSCIVSGAMLKSGKRAANLANRNMRTGSSVNAVDTWRKILFCMSAWPP